MLIFGIEFHQKHESEVCSQFWKILKFEFFTIFILFYTSWLDRGNFNIFKNTANGSVAHRFIKEALNIILNIVFYFTLAFALVCKICNKFIWWSIIANINIIWWIVKIKKMHKNLHKVKLWTNSRLMLVMKYYAKY